MPVRHFFEACRQILSHAGGFNTYATKHTSIVILCITVIILSSCIICIRFEFLNYSNGVM